MADAQDLNPSPEILRDCSHLKEELIEEGSPGHTPFPRKRKIQDDAVFDFDLTPETHPVKPEQEVDVSGNEIWSPPPVPFNSPTDFQLEMTAKEEAKKQEMLIKKSFEESAVLELFKTPQTLRSLGSRKKLRYNVSKMENASKEERILDYSIETSLAEKDMARNAKLNTSLEIMKKVVPGIAESTDKTEIYETAAKYLLFLKEKYGSKHDKEFLEEFLPI